MNTGRCFVLVYHDLMPSPHIQWIVTEVQRTIVRERKESLCFLYSYSAYANGYVFVSLSCDCMCV